jgi:hypothetical protein
MDAAGAPVATTAFKFLFPAKNFFDEAARLASSEAATNAARQARKMRRQLAESLHLDESHVESIAFSMFLHKRDLPIRCFLVKIHAATPLPNSTVVLKFDDERITFEMADPHLCALQMSLNSNICFPATAPVQLDQIGKAFVEIIMPGMFNQSTLHKGPVFDAAVYILRNVAAHMREHAFREAIAGGGILSAAKLWLREDCAEPQHALNISFWRPFDIAEYIFHGTFFGYVFPLCFRLIREKLKQDTMLPPRYREMLLQCIPAAHFDFEIPSSLDWCVHALFCAKT